MAKRPGSVVNGKKLGYFPWAPADFGEGSVVKSFPGAYKVDKKGAPNEYIKAYLEMARFAMNQVKEAVDGLDDQIDPQAVRSDILRFLGQTIAVELDDYEPQEFQRSLVANAVQFYRIKGTKDSYRIRGKISGYDVQVTNIYRIDPDLPINQIESFAFAQGDGSATLNVTGSLPSRPVIAGTVVLKLNGTQIGEDDGAGGFTPSSGSPYGISGSVSYESGAYTAIFVPAPPSGETVTADFATGFQDAVLYDSFGVPIEGEGAAGQTFVAALKSYPPLRESVVVLIDGVPVAHDNGEGAILPIPGAPYTLSGSLVYDTGVLNGSVVESVPLGSRFGVSLTKTLRGEMVQNYPEDIYEIPGDSGYWYSTVEPGVIAGAPTGEQCGYCKTSFVRVLFTLVKPLGVVIPSSTENFFDRLVRKLKDITPIHVRDILYELRFTISIDESANIDAQMAAQEERAWIPTPAFDHFDLIACDSIPLDRRGYVTGTVTLE